MIARDVSSPVDDVRQVSSRRSTRTTNQAREEDGLGGPRQLQWRTKILNGERVAVSHTGGSSSETWTIDEFKFSGADEDTTVVDACRNSWPDLIQEIRRSFFRVGVSTALRERAGHATQRDLIEIVTWLKRRWASSCMASRTVS